MNILLNHETRKKNKHVRKYGKMQVNKYKIDEDVFITNNNKIIPTNCKQ